MTFDPYQEWLAIDASKRPIDYYQLLGITRSKSDLAAIEAAIKLRLEQLDPHTVGARQDAARRLIKEVTAASECLSDPTLRIAYDAKIGAIPKSVGSGGQLRVAEPLRQSDEAHQQATQPSELDAAADSATAVPLHAVDVHPFAVPTSAARPQPDAAHVGPQVSTTSRSGVRRRRKNTSPVAIGMIAAAAMLILVIVIVMATSPRGNSARMVADADSDSAYEPDYAPATSPLDESDANLRDDSENAPRSTAANAPQTSRNKGGGSSSSGAHAGGRSPVDSAPQGPAGGNVASSGKRSPGGIARGPGRRFNKAGGRFIGTGGTWSDDYDPIAFLPESERVPTGGSRSAPSTGSVPSTNPAPPTNEGATTDSPPPAAPLEKVEVPSDTRRAAAEKTIREVFDIDESRTQKERVALLEDMYATAHNSTDDPAAQFVLLEMTRDLAARHGYLGPALAVVGDLTRRFEIDAVQMAIKVVLTTKVAGDNRDANAQHAVVAMRLSEIASKKGDFDLARKLALAAGTAARRNGAAALQEQAKTALRSIREFEGAYEVARPAFETLAADPDNSQANSVCGRYHCFVKEDWETGLAQLALGDHKLLGALARQELNSPQDAASQIALADGWYERADDPSAYAESADERSRTAMLAHAATWYESALAGTSGLKKLKIEQRLEEIAEQSGSVAAAEKPAPEVGTRNIWFMQDVSAPAMPVGTRLAGLPRQQTADPRGPFRRQGVYFRSPAGTCTVVYEIEWSPRPSSIIFRGASLRNFRIEILDKESKNVLTSQTSSLTGRSISCPLGIKVPDAAGNRFYLRLQNDSSLYVDSLEVQE